ncbi:Uncharacterized protein At5g23160 [Linum grandiflorum]
MAGHTTTKPNPKPPATTATVSFGGFFGCSDVNSVAIIKVAATDPPQYIRKINKTNNKKKKPNWFSNWSTKKKPLAAPATVETGPSVSSSEAGGKKDDGQTNSSSDFSTKSKFMIKWRTTKKNRRSSTTPAVTCTVDTANETVSSAAAASDVVPSDGAAGGESIPYKETITTGSSEENNILVGSGNASDHTEDNPPGNRATCKKRFPFCRSKAEIFNDRSSSKNGPSMSQPGTPVPKKPNPNDTVSISRSTTFPGPEHLYRQQPVQLLQPTIVKKKSVGRSGGKDDTKLDSVVGLSIITVTLVIMVVWGRFCAVVCTAAWLYFIPRLRTTLSAGAEVKVKPDRGKNTTDLYESGGVLGRAGDLDLDSVEYKRRVVLEGLLERKRRMA